MANHGEKLSRLAASDAVTSLGWVLADPEGNEACITTWQGRAGSS